MIRFDDIIRQVEQKRPKRHQPPVDNVDVFRNKLESIEKTQSQACEKASIDPKNSKETASKSSRVINNLQKTSRLSLARENGKIYRNDIITNIPTNNSQNNNTFARASDNVDTLRIADCDHCPAGGHWDFKGPGMWCFHRA